MKATGESDFEEFKANCIVNWELWCNMHATKNVMNKFRMHNCTPKVIEKIG